MAQPVEGDPREPDFRHASIEPPGEPFRVDGGAVLFHEDQVSTRTLPQRAAFESLFKLAVAMSS